MKDWKEFRFGEVCEVTSSKRVFLSDYVKEGVPFYRSKEVIEKFNGNEISVELYISNEQYQKFKSKFGVPLKDDILLTSVGTIGVPYKVKENELFYFKDGNLTWIRKYKKDIVPSFLFQWIRSEIGQKTIQQNLIGSSQPALTIDAIKKLKIQLPSIPTQRRIASILSAYDDLIEVNNQRIKLLEETARELYKEWFVRMRFPGHKEAKFVKGVPEGWDVKKLGEVIELAYGKALKAEERKEGEYIVYGSSGIVGTHDSFIAKAPGIVVGRKGNVGSVFWVTKDFYPIDTAFYVKTKISLYYTYFNLQQQHFIEADAAVPGLSRNQAYSLFILIPDKSVIKEFDKIIKPIFEMVSNLDEQNTQLRQIRDRLLPRLISGKLEVK